MGVGVGVCNYKGAACKTEIMKEKKKRKTLTQFLALASQGQTPDWALREDGGDEWDGDANVVTFSVCCLCRRAAPFVLVTFFFFLLVFQRATAVCTVYAGAQCMQTTLC